MYCTIFKRCIFQENRYLFSQLQFAHDTAVDNGHVGDEKGNEAQGTEKGNEAQGTEKGTSSIIQQLKSLDPYSFEV